jgi:hypothetical protein
VNEILYAGLANERTSEALSGDFLLSLASRDSLPGHPALFYAGNVAHRGSLTVKIPVRPTGSGIMAPVAEGASVANSAWTDSYVTITPTRQAIAFAASDIARLTDPAGGIVNAAAFAQHSVMVHGNTLLSLVCNVTDDFTAFVGTSGSNLTVAQYLASIQTLDASDANPGYLTIVHTVQSNDLKSELLATSSGALQWSPATQAQLQLMGKGMKGNFLGSDIFATNRVPTANSGADRAGATISFGAVAWGDMDVDSGGAPNRLVIGGKILFTQEVAGRAAETSWITDGYMAASIGINAAGCSIITDA